MSRHADHALVFAGDERYAQGVAVAGYSALATLGGGSRPGVYVLDNDLSARSRARLERAFRRALGAHAVEWLRVPPERLSHIPTRPGLPSAAFSRLLIPEIVPAHVRRAVYLDADVLVLRDVSPLFTLDLNSAPLAAARDFAIVSTADPMSGIHERAKPSAYFNTGVLVVDLPRWRAERLTEKALAYASASADPLTWADQDALNAVVGRWHELDPRWNMQHRNLRAEKAEGGNAFDTAAVLHFVGPKPWHPSCQTRGTLAWVRTLMISGWFRGPEGLAWLLRWQARRTRHWLGTRRNDVRSRLSTRRSASR